MTEDTDIDPDETLTVSGTTTATEITTINSATLTITDDDSLPTAIELILSQDIVAEGANPVVTVTAAFPQGSGTTVGETVVTVTVGASVDTATDGTDYTAVADLTITIPAGDPSATDTFTFAPTDDTVFDPGETVTVSGSAVGFTFTNAMLAITDTDTAPTEIVLSLSSENETEGADPTIMVTATLSGTVSLTDATVVTVSVGADGDTATEGTDYTEVMDFTVTIPATMLTGTNTFNLAGTDDTLVEEDEETVTVSGTADTFAITSTTLTITDNDDAPTVIALSLNPMSLSEAIGTSSVTVTASFSGINSSSTLSTGTEVAVTLADGTAVAGRDFTAVPAFTVTIPAGETSGTADFSLAVIDDTVVEGPETVMVSGTAGTFAITSATLTIDDNDVGPSAITLSLNPDVVTEGDSGSPITTITVMASFSGTNPSSTLTSGTPVEVTVAGDTATEGTDFDRVSRFTFFIPAGETSGTGIFDLAVIGNTLAEAEETLTVSGTATGFGAIPSATLTIIDNDTDIAPTEITLSLSETGAAEGASPTVTVTATLSPTNVTLPDATVVTVTVGDSGDTATEGTDYTTVGDITVTIPAGVASGTGTFQLQATDDEFADTPETVTVSGTADGFTINQLTLAISDDDVVPTSIVLMPDPASVDVAEGASSRVEVIALFEPSGSVLEVDTRVSVVVGAGGDTATEGTDYTEVGDFTITIPALSAAGMGTFEFAVTDDAVADPGETVTVSGTAAPVLPIDPVMLTIIDGDEAPTEIVLSLSPPAEGENASRTITVTATLSPTSVTLPDDTVVTVTVGDSGDSATEGTDYTAVGDFPITILEGNTFGTGTFLFEVTRDGIVDPDETVTVSGTTTATTITTITDVTLAINNIDTAPTVIVLTHDRGSVTNEGADREVTVTATLSPAVALTADTVVTVTVGDTEDSATEGMDYTTVDDFTITIPREVTSGTGSFQWTVAADVVYDPDESVTISATAGGFDPITSLTLPINDQNTAPTGIQLSLNPVNACAREQRANHDRHGDGGISAEH